MGICKIKVEDENGLHDDQTWIQFLIEMKIPQAVHTLILQYSIFNLSHDLVLKNITSFLYVKVNDSIQLDLATNKVQDIIKFEVRDDAWCCLTFQENNSF